MDSQIHICARCRTQHDFNAQFCPACGGPLTWQTFGQPKKSDGSKTFLIVAGVIACGVILFAALAAMLPKNQPGVPTSSSLSAAVSPIVPPAQSTSEGEYEKVVNNEFGQLTIKSKGGSITSIRTVATTAEQKQKLRLMLIYLEVSDLTAQRACSLTLTFGGWKDRGEIHNCSGDRIGNLNSNAIGYMRDKVSGILRGN